MSRKTKKERIQAVMGWVVLHKNFLLMGRRTKIRKRNQYYGDVLFIITHGGGNVPEAKLSPLKALNFRLLIPTRCRPSKRWRSILSVVIWVHVETYFKRDTHGKIFWRSHLKIELKFRWKGTIWSSWALKSKCNFNLEILIFYNKIKLLTSHDRVLVKTFPLMHHLLT